MFCDTEKRQYRKQGFFIVNDAVDPDMLKPLLEAAIRAKKKVRSDDVDLYTHRSEDGEPWAIRGLFAPEMNEPIFAEYLMSEPIMKYTRAFLGTQLQLGGALIFTNPYEADYGFGWHRDFGSKERDGSYQVEMEILNRPQRGLRWHLALVDDYCLQIVPGSHKRYRTAHERRCLLEERHDDIPGQYAVPLKAGQTVFWTGNLIHRGVMKKDVERLTLSGSWSMHSKDSKPSEVDPRLAWMLADNVRGFLPEEMRPLYDRWRVLQKG